MTLLIKLAFLTCIFYLSLTGLLVAMIFTIAHFRGEVGIYWTTRWGLAWPFGALWLLSFSLAYRLTVLKA